MSDLPASTPPPGLWQRLLEALHRYRYWLAPLSFGAGLASFLLIERREWLAQWVSLLLILGWVLIVTEEAAARSLRLAPAVLRFGVQAIQHETFFFTLPFFLHTTNWATGQAVFTSAVIAAALCALWDPVYYGRIVKRPWLYLVFHAFAVFAGTLTVGPILLHLTTAQTLLLASAGAALLTVPSLLHLIDRARPARAALLVAGAAALAALAWPLRTWVPPATLWVQQAVITDAVDPLQRTPGAALWSVSPAHLHQQGLYAYTAIRAPRGLREQVFHRWLHEGREVDRIPLEIIGGRAEGYRAWSYKQGFPADARGSWEVQVVTEGGQLIGRFTFEVVGDLAPAPLPAPAPELVPQPLESEPELESKPGPEPEQETLPPEMPAPEAPPSPALDPV